MSFWKKVLKGQSPVSQERLSDKQLERSSPPASKSLTSTSDATHVDPRSLTHIILLVDKGEPIPNIRNIPNEVYKIWAQLNPTMAQVLETLQIGVSCYYVEAVLKDPATGHPHPNHFLGPHLDKLYVPVEHSVFVQLPIIAVDGSPREVALETMFRTKEPGCILSMKPLVPSLA